MAVTLPADSSGGYATGVTVDYESAGKARTATGIDALGIFRTDAECVAAENANGQRLSSPAAEAPGIQRVRAATASGVADGPSTLLR